MRNWICLLTLVGSPLFAQATDDSLTPGRWEEVVEVSSASWGDQHASPEELREMSERRMICITPEEAVRRGPFLGAKDNRDCKATRVENSPGRISVTGICSRPGVAPANMSLEGEHGRRFFRMDLDISDLEPGRESFKMKAEMRGAYVGECNGTEVD